MGRSLDPIEMILHPPEPFTAAEWWRLEALRAEYRLKRILGWRPEED